MNNIYVIRDWTDKPSDDDEYEPIDRLMYEPQMFKFLNDNQDRKLVVFRVGECLIDWS